MRAEPELGFQLFLFSFFFPSFVPLLSSLVRPVRRYYPISIPCFLKVLFPKTLLSHIRFHLPYLDGFFYWSTLTQTTFAAAVFLSLKDSPDIFRCLHIGCLQPHPPSLYCHLPNFYSLSPLLGGEPNPPKKPQKQLISPPIQRQAITFLIPPPLIGLEQ